MTRVIGGFSFLTDHLKARLLLFINLLVRLFHFLAAHGKVEHAKLGDAESAKSDIKRSFQALEALEGASANTYNRPLVLTRAANVALRAGDTQQAFQYYDAAENVLSTAQEKMLPLVRILHSSIKDLLGAFVGDKKKFDHAVLVELIPGSSARMVGFLTSDDLAFLGLRDEVSVYLPQSYNFAGQLVVVPRSRVKTLDAPSSDVMTFVVSGGVAGRKEA